MNPADEGAIALRALTVDLLRAPLGLASQDHVFSPWSLFAALAICRAGAAGSTAEAMDSVLHASDATGSLDTAVAALAEHLTGLAGAVANDGGGAGEILLGSANAVWAQAGLVLTDEFRLSTAHHHRAPVGQVDFRGAAESAREEINGWVSDRTAGRIPALIPVGVLDTLTRLVLTNAVHLKAPWARRFIVQSEPLPFQPLGGPAVEVASMAAVADLEHRAGEGWQAVTVPYAGRALALTLVLPDAGSFAAATKAADLDAWLAPAAPRSVLLRLPPFAVRASTDLVGALVELGMAVAFDPDRADFSAMTLDEPLHIAAIAHQAEIEVDAEGTEASAATAVVMAGRAAFREPTPPLPITVDRPFLFVLHDTAHRTPLFVGRVVDPPV